MTAPSDTRVRELMNSGLSLSAALALATSEATQDAAIEDGPVGNYNPPVPISDVDGLQAALDAGGSGAETSNGDPVGNDQSFRLIIGPTDGGTIKFNNGVDETAELPWDQIDGGTLVDLLATLPNIGTTDNLRLSGGDTLPDGTISYFIGLTGALGRQANPLVDGLSATSTLTIGVDSAYVSWGSWWGGAAPDNTTIPVRAIRYTRGGNSGLMLWVDIAQGDDPADWQPVVGGYSPHTGSGVPSWIMYNSPSGWDLEYYDADGVYRGHIGLARENFYVQILDRVGNQSRMVVRPDGLHFIRYIEGNANGSVANAPSLISLNTDIDPTAGDGLTATLGSLYVSHFPAKVWQKSGSGDTDWSELASGSSAWPLTGDVSADGNKITDLADPTDPQDAATRQYVDDNAGGAVTLPIETSDVTDLDAALAGIPTLPIATSDVTGLDDALAAIPALPIATLSGIPLAFPGIAGVYGNHQVSDIWVSDGSPVVVEITQEISAGDNFGIGSVEDGGAYFEDVDVPTLGVHTFNPPAGLHVFIYVGQAYDDTLRGAGVLQRADPDIPVLPLVPGTPTPLVFPGWDETAYAHRNRLSAPWLSTGEIVEITITEAFSEGGEISVMDHENTFSLGASAGVGTYRFVAPLGKVVFVNFWSGGTFVPDLTGAGIVRVLPALIDSRLTEPQNGTLDIPGDVGAGPSGADVFARFTTHQPGTVVRVTVTEEVSPGLRFQAASGGDSQNPAVPTPVGTYDFTMHYATDYQINTWPGGGGATGAGTWVVVTEAPGSVSGDTAGKIIETDGTGGYRLRPPDPTRLTHLGAPGIDAITVDPAISESFMATPDSVASYEVTLLDGSFPNAHVRLYLETGLTVPLSWVATGLEWAAAPPDDTLGIEVEPLVFDFLWVGDKWRGRRVDGIAANVPALAGGADLPTTVAAFNDLLAKMKASGEMVPD